MLITSVCQAIICHKTSIFYVSKWGEITRSVMDRSWSCMPLFSDYKGTWVSEIWRGHLSIAARDFAWPWSGLKNMICSRCYTIGTNFAEVIG